MINAPTPLRALEVSSNTCGRIQGKNLSSMNSLITPTINETVHLVYLGTLYVHPVTRQIFCLELAVLLLAETLSSNNL